MNTALVLAGGIGSRMGREDLPKQYLMIRRRPIIDYSLCALQRHEEIDRILIVAAEAWRDFLDQWLRHSGIGKFAGYADPGETRQFSIFSGLEQIKKLLPDTRKVLIHDAARPFLSEELISACLKGLDEAEGVMPVLRLKDTCYQSEDGKHITGFLPRDQLFAGQAPEAFRFSHYLELHHQMPSEALRQISGSSEMAYKNGMDVLMIDGSERNIKITTQEDLRLMEQYLDGGKSV